MRHFGGLSVEEIAAALNIAARSDERDRALAKLWLFDAVQPADPHPKETSK